MLKKPNNKLLSTELFVKDAQDNYTKIIPKLGFECYNRDLLGFPWGARLSVVYYSTITQSSVKLAPELGFSLWHFLNIFYGYTIPLTNSKLINNNGHKLTLMVNYPLYIQDYKKRRDKQA